MNRFARTTLAGALLLAALAPLHAADTAVASREPGRCNTAVEERNLTRFKTYLSALTSGDFATAQSYFAPGAVVVAYGSVPFAGTYTTADGAWGALQQQYWDFSNVGALEDPVLYADCDKVILNGQFKRVARATGLTVDTRVIEYFSFDAQGLIVRDDFYLADTATVNAVLGVR